mgnify:CR=1 FL=1
MLLILFSFLSGYFQHKASLISQKENRQIDQERLALSLQIDGALQQYKELNNQELSKTVIDTVDKLNIAASTLRDISVKLNSGVNELSLSTMKSKKEIEKVSANVKKVSAEFKKTTTVTTKALIKLDKLFSNKVTKNKN